MRRVGCKVDQASEQASKRLNVVSGIRLVLILFFLMVRVSIHGICFGLLLVFFVNLLPRCSVDDCGLDAGTKHLGEAIFARLSAQACVRMN